VIFVDLETRSRVPIQLGGRAYARCPDLALLVGCAIDLEARRGWAWSPWPGPANAGWREPEVEGIHVEWNRHWGCAIPEAVAQAAASGVCAHNAFGFDRSVWRALGLPPAQWEDSLPLARRAALPGRLERIAKLAYGVGKDPRGEALIQQYCIPDGNGHFTDPPPYAVSALATYCARDTALLAGIWQRYDLGAEHPDDDVYLLDDEINERGWAVDLDYVERIRAAEARIVAAAVAASGLDHATLSSDQQFTKWLKEQGVEVEDVQAGTLERLM